MENTNGAPPPILEEARRLICRQPPGYQAAELRVILDAAKHIPRDEVVSHIDLRILNAADRLVAVFPDSEPDPPTPFDSRIAEALAEEALAEEAWKKAEEERFQLALDLDSLIGSGFVMLKSSQGRPVTVYTGRGARSVASPNRRHVDKARAAAQEGQAAFDRAQEAFERARVARNELEQARSRWRAVASVAK